MQFLWSTVVCAAVLMIVSNMLKGVRCNSFVEALKTSLIYGVLCLIVGKILAVPAVMSTGIVTLMTFGLGFPFMVLFWGLAICAPSLYIADQLIDGFEIQDFQTTVLVAFLVGVGNYLLKVVGLL